MRWVCVQDERQREGAIMERKERIASLMQVLDERIVLLDGAMGTMIQSFGLSEEDYRGERFARFRKQRYSPNTCPSDVRCHGPAELQPR